MSCSRVIMYSLIIRDIYIYTCYEILNHTRGIIYACALTQINFSFLLIVLSFEGNIVFICEFSSSSCNFVSIFWKRQTKTVRIAGLKENKFYFFLDSQTSPGQNPAISWESVQLFLYGTWNDNFPYRRFNNVHGQIWLQLFILPVSL